MVDIVMSSVTEKSISYPIIASHQTLLELHQNIANEIIRLKMFPFRRQIWPSVAIFDFLFYRISFVILY